MDIGATNAFVLIVANSMTGVSTNDINIIKLRNGATSLPQSDHHILAVADKSVNITFTTRLFVDGSSSSDISSSVSARQAELTAAFADPATAQSLVNRSVEFGSTTVTSSTEVVLGAPTFITTSTPKESSSSSSTSKGLAIFIAVVIIAAIISGVVGLCLNCCKVGNRRETGWNSVAKAVDDYPEIDLPETSGGDNIDDMEMVQVDLDYIEDMF